MIEASPSGPPTYSLSADGEIVIELSEPAARIRVRAPHGVPGRAEARFGKQSWAAKHYWRDVDEVTVYEFDEPIPAGRVVLRVPISGGT